MMITEHYDPDSMLTLGQRRANVGTSVGPTLAQRLFDRRPNVGPTSASHQKKITHCMASTNQIVHKQLFQCEFIMRMLFLFLKL